MLPIKNILQILSKVLKKISLFLNKNEVYLHIHLIRITLSVGSATFWFPGSRSGFAKLCDPKTRIQGEKYQRKIVFFKIFFSYNPKGDFPYLWMVPQVLA